MNERDQHEIHIRISVEGPNLTLSEPAPTRAPGKPSRRRSIESGEEWLNRTWYATHMSRALGREGYQVWKSYKAARVAYDNGNDVELGAPEMRDSSIKRKVIDGFKAGKGLHRSYLAMTDMMVSDTQRWGERIGEDPEMIATYLEDRVDAIIEELNISQDNATQMKARIHQIPFAA